MSKTATSTSTTAPVWLITGSSAGLGLALTRYAISQGHRVVATSRSPSKVPELVSQVESAGGKYLALDVAAPETEVLDLVRQAEAIFGRIDVLANIAGYAVMGALEDTPIDEVARQMETNFYGPLKLIRGVLPGMRERKTGMILNFSSAQGLCPSPANGVYAASKAALEAATESLGAEVATWGIRVMLFEAGAFRTDFAGSDNATYVEPSEPYAGEKHPVGSRLAMVKKYIGTAMGDPDKAAKVMFEVATTAGNAGRFVSDQKFLRVIIGPDCWGRVDQVVSELRRTVDMQKDLAASTNF